MSWFDRFAKRGDANDFVSSYQVRELIEAALTAERELTARSVLLNEGIDARIAKAIEAALVQERARISEALRYVALNLRLEPEDNACWLAWLIRYHVLGKDIE